MAVDIEKGVVLITGCSSGLGVALVRRYLESGYRVWATVRDKMNPGDLAGLRAEPGLAILSLDVTDAAAVTALLAELPEGERLAALVINAGAHVAGVVESANVARTWRLFEANFMGALYCVQAAAPLMRKQGGGNIIAISSLSAHIGLPCDGVYAASKAALERLLESLRVELAPFGVGVNAVIPSSFPSRLLNRPLPQPLEKDSPYYSLLLHSQERALAKSSGSVAVVVDAVFGLMGSDSVGFRVPADAVATSVLGCLYQATESERGKAALEWSGTQWWADSGF